MKSRHFDITPRSVFVVIGTLLSLWLLYYIRDILFHVYLAIIIVFILDPIVKRLNKYKIPRALGVLLVYISVISLLVFSIAGIVPAVVSQFQNFVTKLPSYLENVGISPAISTQISSQLLSRLGDSPLEAVRVGFSVFSNIVEIVTILIFAFYFLMIREQISSQVSEYFGVKIGNEFKQVSEELEWRLGGWARGQLTLMLIVGVCTYVGLTIIGVPYSLPLSVMAALLEAVPMIGPLLAAGPAVLVAFSISPFTGIATTALAFFIQQFENYVFVPKVMERSVGITPLATLIALTIGARFAGIIGVLISVPTMIVLLVFFERYFLRKRPSVRS